jgi:PhnB protein
MKSADPYIYLDGNTEEAFDFYKSVFGGEFHTVLRFRDIPGNPMGVADADLEKIAHIALPLGDNNTLMGTDYLESFPDELKPGNNFCLVLAPESADEAEQLFEALCSNGEIKCALQRANWAEKHGECLDRFGIRWMVTYSGDVRTAQD